MEEQYWQPAPPRDKILFIFAHKTQRGRLNFTAQMDVPDKRIQYFRLEDLWDDEDGRNAIRKYLLDFATPREVGAMTRKYAQLRSLIG